MPYIKKELRDTLVPAIGELLGRLGELEPDQLDGALNYTVSELVSHAFNPQIKNWSYVDIARAVAVFECAKLEFYRRVAVPKENRAIAENGDTLGYQPFPVTDPPMTNRNHPAMREVWADPIDDDFEDECDG